MPDKPKYSIVVPLYNEEAVIEECYKRLKAVMDSCGELYELIFIDDGSRDKTPEMARELAAEDSNLRVLRFSRNFGHQPAITAGMDEARGEAVIVIDADLQDPPEIMLVMIEQWKQGFEVVYGKRAVRKGETAFKKLTAKIFYRSLNAMTDVNLPVDAGDFRLLDRKVIETLKSMPERNRYVRGLVSWVGYKQTAVEYIREERFAGETKYPLRKMLALAGNAITSFSLKPLKLATWIGTLLSMGSFGFLIYVIIDRLFIRPDMAAGWASMVAIMLFFNGIVLIMLGIVGQYIGRIYDETKGRPQYIVAERLNDNES
ncbi:MAG: glycosyltransferase family 2 protein [Oscillospiraceae bacterium]|nr:glycosyltransferase family 2 protein [Oscillospiraceae bacterium]